MVDAGLHLDDRRQREPEDLVHPAFHFAGDLGAFAALLHFHSHHQPGVRQAEETREHRAGRTVTDVVRLRTGEHYIGSVAADGRRQSAGGGERVAALEGVVLEMHGPFGTERETFAQRFFHSLGPDAVNDHLAAGFFGNAQAFFEGVFVAFVDHVFEVFLVEPAAVFGNAQPGFGVGDLLDADRYAHRALPELPGEAPEPIGVEWGEWAGGGDGRPRRFCSRAKLSQPDGAEKRPRLSARKSFADRGLGQPGRDSCMDMDEPAC